VNSLSGRALEKVIELTQVLRNGGVAECFLGFWGDFQELGNGILMSDETVQAHFFAAMVNLDSWRILVVLVAWW
jgi:hypothetical protein